MKNQIEAIFAKRDELKKMLPSFSSDDLMKIALTDFFANGHSKQEMTHAEFVESSKETVIPRGDKRNYSPKVLRDLRLKANLTQRAVELQLGKKFTWLSQYETGKARNIDPFEKSRILAIYNGQQ